MGRKTKYTPEVVARVVEAIKMGASYELAAGYAGIHYDTFNEWMKAKSEFSEAVKKAEGVGAMVWLAKIEKAATEGEWQAAAWKLERRYPEAYAKNYTRMEVTGKDGKPIALDLPALDPELAGLARGLLARLAGASSTDTGGPSVSGE